jgi:hypothetical protein
MKLLTGTDRVEYESLLFRCAVYSEKADAYAGVAKQAEERCARLEAQLQYEKERADRAVDELLAVRGCPPVSPPQTEFAMNSSLDFLDEDPDKVAAIERRIAQGDATVFTEAR